MPKNQTSSRGIFSPHIGIRGFGYARPNRCTTIVKASKAAPAKTPAPPAATSKAPKGKPAPPPPDESDDDDDDDDDEGGNRFG